MKRVNEEQNRGTEMESPLPEKKTESSGEYLWRVLKPAGCVLVLILFILYFVVCFTAKAPAASPTDLPPAQTETAGD